LKTPVTVMVV